MTRMCAREIDQAFAETPSDSEIAMELFSDIMEDSYDSREEDDLYVWEYEDMLAQQSFYDNHETNYGD